MAMQARSPRVPLPLVHIDAVPFVGRWTYLLWRLRNPDDIIEFALPDVASNELLDVSPSPETSPLEPLDHALGRACLMAELLFARCLNVYENLPLHSESPSDSKSYLRLPTIFRYHEWKPEKTLFGMLSEFWETIFEMWAACHRRQWFIPHLDAEPSKSFQQQLERWATKRLSGIAPYFRREPWFVWHVDWGELDASVVEHPVGQFRLLCERIFVRLADWNSTSYRLTQLLPKASELIELMGEMVELIAVRCKQEMEEL